MGKPGSCSSTYSLSNPPAPRIERKIIEKNRRNRMKILYSNLISFLPNNISKEGLPLPDQIGEVVEYIETLKTKLEKLKQRKESLLPRKTSCSTSEDQATKSSHFVEVHDMGPNMDVILIKGLKDYSTFQRIISFIQGNGVEIASANFSFGGNSSIQVLQDKVGRPNLGFGSPAVVEKLKELVCGSTSRSEVVDSQLNVWDYEIDSNIWGF